MKTSLPTGAGPLARRALFAASLALACTIAAAASANTPRVPSRVFLNGVATPVYFNDGDSFQVLGGELEGTRARLAGFNTLESFGSVHRWGDWNAKELYTLAKMATLNARKGVWHCESEMERDTYGRILWFCLDLAVDQVKKGYAHAMTVDTEPGLPAIVAAQRDAMKHRRGIWAHGIPAYVMTSVHSITEGGRDGKVYNRLVSTRDGHSASYKHAEPYAICDWVCTKERDVPAEVVAKTAEALSAHPDVAPIQAQYASHFGRIAEEFATLGYFVGVKNDAHAEILLGALRDIEGSSPLRAIAYQEGSCVLYVPFENRFNEARAKCLD